MSATSMSVQADDALMEALTSGKVDFSFRPRYEFVEDDSKTDDGDAFTVRSTLGYKTGSFHNVFGYIQFENTTDVLSDTQYNDTRNGRGTLPTIADPSGTEINQAFLGGTFMNDTLVKVGRQIITPRAAPFHRFLGTVLWRQNWQTQDSITVTNTSLPDTTLLAGYIWNNNTIFGTDRDMSAPILNAQYKGLKYVNLEGYYYDLEFDDLPGLSTETYGLRADGGFPIFKEGTRLIYTAEYAMQEEGGNSAASYDADYYLFEGGFKTRFDGMFIKSLMAKVSYEVLESAGDGVNAFKTPLATGHAFQGWADNFLATPAAGIEDTYFTVVATGAYDTKLIVSYHMLEAENAGFDYGDELDIWFTKKFAKHYTVGLKYAGYDASSDVGNPKSTDLSKYWAYFTFKY